MANERAPTIVQYDVVIVRNLETHQSNIPEVLHLIKQIASKRLEEPISDERALEHLKETIQKATVFFVIQPIDADTKRIVGLAILNTNYTVTDTVGHIGDFVIIDNESIAMTRGLKYLLTKTIIDHARSLGMTEVSFNGYPGNPNVPDHQSFYFRNTCSRHVMYLNE